MVIVTKKELKRLEERGAKAEEDFKEGIVSLESGIKSVIEMSDIIAKIKKKKS